MDDHSMLIPQPELRFEEIVTRILQSQGYRSIPDHEPLMQKNDCTYHPVIRYSRTRVFPTASAVPIFNQLNALWQTDDRIPLVLVGGELAPSVKAELKGVNSRTLVLDIQNLLYMAASNRELYDELVSQLPYPVGGLTPSPHTSVSTSTEPPFSSGAAKSRGTGASGFDFPGGDDRYIVTGNHGTGKTDTILQMVQAQTQKASQSAALRRELTQWQGGRGNTLSTDYEKLCTRVLKQLFGSDDLTLWQEQAKSNDELYRFDLICKIKRDNRKDFWEMAEHHFHSKYIIFEFKNYSGKVTQMEVTTTARYLYTKALRSIAIIVSPNGFSDHAEKAARGSLREDGKLILALTNAELVKMLQMQENGTDPAEYLSEKLDTLLINLEK